MIPGRKAVGSLQLKALQAQGCWASMSIDLYLLRPPADPTRKIQRRDGAVGGLARPSGSLRLDWPCLGLSDAAYGALP